MDIEICCLKCRKKYKVWYSNTRVEGPVIRTTCPFCKTKTERSFSKFVELQLCRKNFNSRFEFIMEAVRYARQLEEEMK